MPVADQDRIREAYERYRAAGRDHLWDRSNPGYARLSDDRDAALLGLIASSVPTERPSTFVDLGCGTGSLVAAVAEGWATVGATGLDLLPERIEAAQSQVRGATFLVGSADSLPFPDRSFDVAAAVTLFSSLPSPQMEVAVAQEIARVLRRGGWLVWYDLRYDNPGNPSVHGIGRRRLDELFPGWVTDLRSVTLVPPLARRLGRATPVAYPLLHRLPLLRTHLVGRLQCPA